MMSVVGTLRRALLGIDGTETTFAARQFPGPPSPARDRLETIGRVFLSGYHIALEADSPDAAAARLDALEAETRGFAYEGAAMALALLDRFTPWRRNRVTTFLAGPGKAHVYMVHVGIGIAAARLRRRVKPVLRRLDPVLGRLVLDGYGFHEGFFHWRASIQFGRVPDRLDGDEQRVFDQGLGRSLWFVEGADVGRIASAVVTFAEGRRADLWSGIGLACAYAGGVDRDAIEWLRDVGGEHGSELAQGAAFAAKARQRAGNPAAHTDTACEILCGMPSDAAARVTDEMLEGLPRDGWESAYEVWRRRIGRRFVVAASIGVG